MRLRSLLGRAASSFRARLAISTIQLINQVFDPNRASFGDVLPAVADGAQILVGHRLDVVTNLLGTGLFLYLPLSPAHEIPQGLAHDE